MNHRYQIISVGQDHKTVKGEKYGYLTGVIYLQPYRFEGQNLCPKASAGCIKSCLFTAGMGKFNNVIEARQRKTRLFVNEYEKFMQQLVWDIEMLTLQAKQKNMIPVVRLNGTSDILWEKRQFNGKTLFELFPEVQFMDYTKIAKRFDEPLPANYHLTFSRTEKNAADCERLLSKGFNVAVVYRVENKKVLKRDWPTKIPAVFSVNTAAFPTVNGDDSDLRFTDGAGKIVMLTAKGRAKKDESGFVVNL